MEDLIPPWDRHALHMIVLLRLAVLLRRGRSPAPLPAIEVSGTPRTLEVRFGVRWLKDHPLTVADLAAWRVLNQLPVGLLGLALPALNWD